MATAAPLAWPPARRQDALATDGLAFLRPLIHPAPPGAPCAGTSSPCYPAVVVVRRYQPRHARRRPSFGRCCSPRPRATCTTRSRPSVTMVNNMAAANNFEVVQSNNSSSFTDLQPGHVRRGYHAAELRHGLGQRLPAPGSCRATSRAAAASSPSTTPPTWGSSRPSPTGTTLIQAGRPHAGPPRPSSRAPPRWPTTSTPPRPGCLTAGRGPRSGTTSTEHPRRRAASW